MIPNVLDPDVTPLALVGRGEIACRRLEALLAGGADRIAVFSDRAPAKLAELALGRLRRRLPSPAELAEFRVLWIAGLPLREAAALAALARGLGVLVNVEDVRPWCDFHNPSVVRRGDLLLTVSTSGRSPGLAARIRRQLADSFGPEWARRLEQVSDKRAAWRRTRRAPAELAQLTDALIDRRGWLRRPPSRGSIR
jgi:precorrin-2 dehydrogenase/sirohydrochlorin ferrochelatase